jgi:hypothetical protein
VPLFFPYADRTVRAEREADGAVRFSLFRDFPLLDAVQMAIIDQGDHLFLELPGKFPKPVPFGDLDPALRDPLERLSEGLWHTFRVVQEFRQADAKGAQPDANHRISELRAAFKSKEGEQKELLSTVDFEAEDLTWPAMAEGTHPAPPPHSVSRDEAAVPPPGSLDAGPAPGARP